MAINKIKLPDNTTEDINDSRLPAVTTTDNGKLLGVDGGIWSKVNKPSYTLDEVSDGSTRKLSDYQPVNADLTAIAGLPGTSGLLKKTAANTWSLDTNTYYYSGNSNKDDVDWSCKKLTTSGNIYTVGALGINRTENSAYPMNQSAADLIIENDTAAETGQIHGGNIIISRGYSASANTSAGAISFYGRRNIEGIYRNGARIAAVGGTDGATYDRVDLVFYSSNNTSTAAPTFNEAMRIKANGDITVGTSSSNSSLLINGNTVYHSGNSNKSDVAWSAASINLPNGTGAVNWKDSGGTNRTFLNVNSSNQLVIGYGTIANSATTVIYGSAIAFNTGSSGTEYMRIDTAGNVGIGTASPTYKLHISGTTGFADGHIYLTGAQANSSTGNTTQLIFGTSTTNHVSITSNTSTIVINPTSSTTTGQIVLGTNGKNTSFSSSGKFGIGTVSPSEKLSVSGNIVATGTITPGSDSRIKDNQREISQEDAFSVIENLKPKTWTWNEKSNENLNGKAAAGLVAQEVKEVLPEAVTVAQTEEFEDFHSLNYNTIQGYELAAIKGLIEEVKSLKAEIAELKKQIK